MKKVVLNCFIIHLLLVISGLAQNRLYNAGEISSNQTFKYGKFEARLKSAVGSGIISSFYLFNKNDESVWNEIDFECFGKNDIVQTNYWIPGKIQNPKLVDNPAQHKNFKTYVIEWTPEYIEWFINGQSVRGKVKNSYINDDLKVFFNIWLSNSEQWAGKVSGNILGEESVIDYFKYYRYNQTENKFELNPSFIEDFNSLSNWSKSLWTFDDNLADFVSDNVNIENNNVVLKLSSNNTTVGSNSSESSAIVVCVDGLSFANTILPIHLESDNNYLQKAISEMNIPNLEIVSFNWDRDAKKTDYRLKDLRKMMRKYYEKAQRENKKFIVVSHSWGTFLAYMALSFESQATNPIHADLFITLSCPMGTYYAHALPLYAPEILINGFVAQWMNGLKYSKCFNCYPSIDRWVNFWAWGDLISGPMKEYDSNVEDINVDSLVAFTEYNRSPATTNKWHVFTKLLPNGNNELLINKVKELICSVVSCTSTNSNNKITLGYILDSSGSMQQNDPYNMRKSAMKVIVDELQGNENVFLIDFDDKATWLNSNNWQNVDKSLLKSQIDIINSDGGTNIGGGLDALKSAIQSTNVNGRMGVVLLSDGLGDYNNNAEWFVQNNIPVYTISFIGSDNSKLLSGIASLTGGRYIKANSDNDIITAFNQFVNFLRGNSILKVYKSRISLGETLMTRFFVESYLRYLFITLAWRGSKIGLTLTSPDGKVYSYKNPTSGWTSGDNYTYVKIDNPAAGEWKAEMYGVDIPSGGEDLNFQVSGDSPTKIDLNEKTLVNGQIKFSLDTPAGSSISNVTPKIEVTTPTNKKEDISASFTDDGFDYRPDDGKGNYNFEINLTGKDQSGSDIQRYYSRTVLVGEYVPANIAPVKLVEGAYLLADLGSEIGNYAGLKCDIISRSTNKKIAVGYVTYVTKNECTIEVQQYHTNDTIGEGDIVELDVTQWQKDVK